MNPNLGTTEWILIYLLLALLGVLKHLKWADFEEASNLKIHHLAFFGILLILIHIQVRPITKYAMCALMGIIVCGMILLRKEMRDREIISDPKEYEIFLFAVLLSGALFARFFHYFTNSHSISECLMKFIDLKHNPMGLTALGGVFGGTLAIIIYGIIRKTSIWELANATACITPAALAFGRIGCTYNGCCHGVVYHGSAPSYAIMSQGGTAFPIQPISSFLLCIIFVIVYQTRKKWWGSLPLFLLLYPLYRIPVEYFRHDPARAFYLGISESQWFSGLIFIIGIICFTYVYRQEKAFRERPRLKL